MKVSTDEKKIDELLTRGVDTVYPTRDALKAKMLEKKPLRVYLGIDPTSPHLHLGHAGSLLMLRRFQDLGHEVILLIGDFTARIGDPTDKLAARKALTKEEVRENFKTFEKQASKILSFSGANAARVEFNSTWHAKMTFEKVIDLASHFTVQQILERDMFQKRMKPVFTYECPHCKNRQVWDTTIKTGNTEYKSSTHGTGLTKDRACTNCQKIVTFQNAQNSFKFSLGGMPIYLQEFLYPLMQGYDSVEMDVDVEVGGTDQTFNMLAGRTLMKAIRNKEKFVITNRLLEDPTTGRKMSKTEGTLVNLDDEPNDMFGKVMALPDGLILNVAELSTMMPMENIATLKDGMNNGENPRDAKLKTAFAVVKTYHGETAAEKARDAWIKTFSEKEKPENAPRLRLGKKTITGLELLLAAGVASKSEARRLVEQKAVKINDETVAEPEQALALKSGDLLRIGKHRFFEIE